MELSSHPSFGWARREDLSHARYRTDFEILRKLGQGAFGTTFKVKNRLDSQVYAMKAVRLGKGIMDAEDRSRVLREVEVLSSLNSEHIVRYFAAWIEKAAEEHIFQNDEENFPGSSCSDWSSLDSTSTNGTANNIATVSCECQICNSSYKDWEVSFEAWGLIDTVLQPLNLCTNCYSKSLPVGLDVSGITIKEKEVLHHEYLFILMEYCESLLLQEVSKFQHEQNNARIWSLFAQCVQGVSHLHSRGIIHRDIKPSNIFCHGGVAKIGDLGLATTTTTKKSLSSCEKGSYASGSTGVGTFLYAAPEVDTGRYRDKCDVFSLGVVLVEMFSHFNTAMERARVLGGLRLVSKEDEDWNKQWVQKYPYQARLAKRMVSDNIHSRPSCGEVLGELLVEKLWDKPNIEDMERVVFQVHNELKILQTKLKERDAQIEGLKEQLQNR
eukprot:CAMPEP_0195530738 /NCGR_PEP_ID=MMETSP0794_2-20130614/33768_1 /TAXON_ID=515487 /ORGANISM="Stephanopyxis turris, Strain CCMP 815" /LENGTH=439 /DNA_ID=CAMNT_0040662313 /DNA_START=194 /DNA_END=1513 /DNA_ORIENTATION=+